MNRSLGLICAIFVALFCLGSPAGASFTDDATASTSVAGCTGSANLDERNQSTQSQDIFSVFLKLEAHARRGSMDGIRTRVEFRDLNGRTIADCGIHYPADDPLEVGAGLPAEALHLWIKPTRFLSRTRLLSFPSDDDSTLTLKFIGGDLDDDNSIGMFDYLRVRSFLDIGQDDPEWFQRVDGIRPVDADLNGDKIIDFADIEELSDHLGEAGE